MGVSAAVLGAALVSTFTSVSASNKAQDQAQEAENEQENQQAAQLKQANDEETNAEGTLDANAVRDSQRMIQQQNALKLQGRAGTILTSPLGVTNGNPNAATAPSKTLLGA
jgi:hypothetical protein